MKQFKILYGALVLLLAIPASAQTTNVDKVSRESGQWSSIAWDLWNGSSWAESVAPILNENVNIENGNSVVYSTGASPNFRRLYVGNNVSGGAANGSLEISGGTLTVNTNTAGAIVAALSDNSVGTISVTGGTLRGTGSSSGSGIQVGVGANSQGTFNLSGSGVVTLTQGVVLGLGNGATANMNVSGGSLATSVTNVSSFYVGGRATGKTTNATYEQTAGTVTISNSGAVFAVGYAGIDQIVNASARITGGTLTGNVRIGRQIGTNGSGSGLLTIGPDATIIGSTGTWEIGATGELALELGSMLDFNALDLTASTASNALVFSEAGAKITIDGTNLVAAESYLPVNLINYVTGKGPTADSLTNLTVNYTGFADGLVPELTWTDTSLQLSVTAIPEPSTYAALLAVAALGVSLLRRRSLRSS